MKITKYFLNINLVLEEPQEKKTEEEEKVMHKDGPNLDFYFPSF